MGNDACIPKQTVPAGPSHSPTIFRRPSGAFKVTSTSLVFITALQSSPTVCTMTTTFTEPDVSLTSVRKYELHPPNQARTATVLLSGLEEMSTQSARSSLGKFEHPVTAPVAPSNENAERATRRSGRRRFPLHGDSRRAPSLTSPECNVGLAESRPTISRILVARREVPIRRSALGSGV